MTSTQKIMSLFDVLGPIMTGPSSSATAGAGRIGQMGRMLLGSTPRRIEMTFTESFGCKYSGNFTDAAVVAGLMNFTVDAPEIRNALDLARDRGIAVTVKLRPDPPATDGPAPISIGLDLADEHSTVSLIGLSVGGGEIVIAEVNGIPTDFTGTEDMVLVFAETGLLPALSASNALSGTWCYLGNGMYRCMPDTLPTDDALHQLESLSGVRQVRAMRSLLTYHQSQAEPLFISIADMIAYCNERHCSLAQAAIDYEQQRSGMDNAEVRSRCLEIWETMSASVERGLEGKNPVLRRLVPGNAGALLARRVREGRALCGDTAGMAAARALACMENNACMGRVVAAPTAGACGLVPGVLLSAAERLNCSQTTVVEALMLSALIGVAIATRAPVSGTIGGCQSEVGVASAMAAAALVFMDGGTPEESGHAVAIALKNILGLICDPVAGAVEVPCIKRNAMGVVNAMIAADMARAGVVSAIPVDEVVGALVSVQRELPRALRNSGHGGLCTTPTAIRLTKQYVGNDNS